MPTDCENCKEENQLYELAESKCCENCWRDYWQENDIGEDTSFNDFLNYTCSLIKEESKNA